MSKSNGCSNNNIDSTSASNRSYIRRLNSTDGELPCRSACRAAPMDLRARGGRNFKTMITESLRFTYNHSELRFI